MADNNYRRTEGVLYNYRYIKTEIENIEIDIEEIKAEYTGITGITYEEKTGPTNKFNSSVENEVTKKDKLIKTLTREMKSKKRLIKKIDNALGVISSNKNEETIVRLRYFKRKSWDYIGSELKLDPDYCRAIKRDAIKHLSDLIWIKDKHSD